MAPAWYRFFEIPNLTAAKSFEVTVNPNHIVDRTFPSSSNVALDVYEVFSDTLVPGSEKSVLFHDSSIQEAVVKVTWATDEVFEVPSLDDVRSVVWIINERMLYVLEMAKAKGPTITIFTSPTSTTALATPPVYSQYRCNHPIPP